MTREDIIRMAQEANILEPMGFDKPNMAQWRDDIVRELERFAALVAADEREACAKVCEEDAFVEQWKGLAEAVKRIRARGQA
jgi:hypothetical protein